MVNASSALWSSYELAWTEDILVALFFACVGENNKDGVVFVCDKNDYKEFKNYESNINRQSNDIEDISFIRSYIINPRLRAQRGCFMMWSYKDNCARDLESLLEEKDACFLTKIIIPVDKKEGILRELAEEYNITTEALCLRNDLPKNRDRFKDESSDNIKSFEEFIEPLLKLNEYISDGKIEDKELNNKIGDILGVSCNNMFGEAISYRGGYPFTTTEKLESFLSYYSEYKIRHVLRKNPIPKR